MTCRPKLQADAHPTGVGPLPPADESFVDTPRGRFRVLHWPGEGVPVLLLHGLSGISEVWGPLVRAFGQSRRPLYAFDQRGHGKSTPATGGYTAGDFVADTLAVTGVLGLDRPHIAGHSMGGRVVFSMGARLSGWFRSAAVVDMGPEAWKANWQSSIESFQEVPRSFATEADAIAYASRGREMSDTARAVFVARLRPQNDGSTTWWADWDALEQTVRSQRSRDFWRQWERLPAPLLLVRGENSRELREQIAAEMRRRNPAAHVEQIPGVGHNIPLQAPDELAQTLQHFWRSAEA